MSDLATSKDADELTPESRLQYLKDHGVLVETNEERAQKADAVSGSPLLAQLRISKHEPASPTDTLFTLIPHDTSSPFRSLSLTSSTPFPPSVDAIPEYVRPYFADSNSIDIDLLQSQATKQFASGNMKDLASTNISASAMNRVAAAGSVETFPLVHPADTNDYTGVYIYLDEVGLLKKLPPNKRATAIALECGYNPPPNFYGDVFIGRCGTKPSMRNVDFVAGKDTAGGSEWMKKAVGENLAWQQAMNGITGKKGSQPGNPGEDGAAVVTDNYSWTQNDEEVEITFNLNFAINKNKVKAAFRPKSVTLAYDGKELDKLALYGRIDVDGCTWTLDGNSVVVTVEKIEPGVSWPRITDAA